MNELRLLVKRKFNDSDIETAKNRLQSIIKIIDNFLESNPLNSLTKSGKQDWLNARKARDMFGQAIGAGGIGKIQSENAIVPGKGEIVINGANKWLREGLGLIKKVKSIKRELPRIEKLANAAHSSMQTLHKRLEQMEIRSGLV